MAKLEQLIQILAHESAQRSHMGDPERTLIIHFTSKEDAERTMALIYETDVFASQPVIEGLSAYVQRERRDREQAVDNSRAVVGDDWGDDSTYDEDYGCSDDYYEFGDGVGMEDPHGYMDDVDDAAFMGGFCSEDAYAGRYDDDYDHYVDYASGDDLYQINGPDVDDMDYEQLLDLGEAIGTVVIPGLDEATIRGLLQPEQCTAELAKHTCSICLEHHKRGQAACSLPCTHIFHDNCISEWLRRSSKCPLCLTELV